MRTFFSNLALLASLLTGTTDLSAQTVPGPVLTIGKIPRFYGLCLFSSGYQATNFVLQTSLDLTSWTNVFQSYGQPGTNPVYFAEVQTAQAFWRATAGEPLLVQKKRWTNQEPVEYSFYLRHMISYWQGGVRGTVRVLNGTITGVTNAIDDRTLQPISNPDLSQFLTITQLFDEIGSAFEGGAEQIQVRYDPSGLYPQWVLIDPLISIVDDESKFEVSQFTVLQP